MGLNAKEIPVCFLRMIQVSIDASFTFIRRHPLISGVLIILCILYLFLSYIYHFLVYLFPFLVCAAIFVTIFWSSEEGHLRYFKKYEEKEEPKENEKRLYKSPSYGKRDMLLERRYSPGNATSRRRNFTDKKCDVQDAVVEAKGKESSTVESCGSEKKDVKPSENEENSSNFAEKLQNIDTQSSPLPSEATISELVKAPDSDQQNNKSDRCGDELVLEKEKCSSVYAEKSQNTDAKVSPSEPEPSNNDQVKTSDSDQQIKKSDCCSDKPAIGKEDTTKAKVEKEQEEEEEGEGEESREETKKAVEWSKDDQKNLMDLGISEIERNRRLESLIARRRARQQMKLQIEQGLSLADLRTPTRMAPLNIARIDPLKSPRNYGGIEGLEIPGSAPSALRQLRNPFDLPYDASEEKPNLSGDSFQQEFIPKDITFCRHESFSYGASLQFDEEYPFFINGRKISDRFRRLPDKGNHDLIIEKLFSKSNDNSTDISTGVKAPKPLLVKFETTTTDQEENNTKSKTESIFGLKWKKLMENAKVLKSMSDHTVDETDHKISKNNDQLGVISSEKPEEEEPKTPHHRHHHKPINNKKFLNFPIATGTAIVEAPLDSLSSPTIKNPEDMSFPEGCIFHKPTCSIASDLQVEFSEIGSPTTLTVDGESLVFDGEVDKDTAALTPRTDDLGPISIKLRSCDEGAAEMSNNNSPIHFLHKVVGEEDVIDVSSMSSTSDLHGDSPTHAINNYDYNIFSDMGKYEVETRAKTLPSDFLVGRSLDHHPPHETQPQKPEEGQNLSESSESEAQVLDHHQVSSPSSTSDSHGDTPTHERISYDYNVFSDMKKDEIGTQATQPSYSSTHESSSQSEKSEKRQNLSETEAQILDHHNVNDASTTDIENSNGNEDLRPPFVHQHQESIDAVSMKTFSSLSPRSLSPDKTLMDHVSSYAFNQHISANDVPQLNIEDMTQEPQTSEVPPNTMPPVMSSSVSSDFQEPTCSSTMTDDYNTKDTLFITRNMDPAENNEATLIPSKVTENVGISTTIEEHGQMAAELTQLADVDPSKPNEPEISNKEKTKDQLNNDTLTKPNDSSENASDTRKNGEEISGKEGIKEELGNGMSSEPNDNIVKVSDIHEKTKVSEAITSSSSVGDEEAKNNEAIEQEPNKKEPMVLSSSVGTSEASVTRNTKEPEEAVNSVK